MARVLGKGGNPDGKAMLYLERRGKERGIEIAETDVEREKKEGMDQPLAASISRISRRRGKRRGGEPCRSRCFTTKKKGGENRRRFFCPSPARRGWASNHLYNRAKKKREKRGGGRSRRKSVQKKKDIDVFFNREGK